jgi:putative SOS response-associated peptidase YedK
VCGRYAASRDPDELVEEFEVDATAGDGPGGDPAEATPDFNVAPTVTAPVVLERAPRPAPDGEPEDGSAAHEPADPVRWLRLLTWGLVPSWAKDRSIGSRMINARAESMLDKPAFRRAAVSRRCLVPADGWYEWQASPTEKDAKGRPRKQPFFVSAADGAGIALAGAYEFWRDDDRHADDPQAWLTSYAVVTTKAEPGLDVIHDRMPLVLPRERWDAWLDPRQQDPDAIRALLEPPEPGRFTAVPISTRVNSVRNNGPELLAPLPAGQLHGVVDPATGELLGAGDASLF